MTRKFIVLLLWLILLLQSTTAQRISVGYDIGYGTYQMNDIRKCFKRLLSFNVFNPQCVSDFPGYLYFRPYVKKKYPYYNLGFAYTLMSTGSRYSFHDYSGDYTYDGQISGNAGAVFMEYPLITKKKFQFTCSAESGIIFNILKIHETMELSDVMIFDNKGNFYSLNMFLKPYLKVEYKITNKILVNAQVGYHKDIFRGILLLNGTGNSESDLLANWDGIRAGIGVSYRFK